MTNQKYFNTLAITGKVVDKPDFFEGLLTFTLFQEDTNLSVVVFYECSSESDMQLHIGQLVNVNGKLCYDSDEDSLFLHANYIFAGEKPRKTFKRQQVENIQQKNTEVENRKNTEVSVANSETEEKEANLPPSSPNKEVTKEANPNEEVIVAPRTEDSSNDLEVGLAPITTHKSEPDQPVQVEKPSSTTSDTPSSNQEKSTFRLFNLSDDAIERPEPVEVQQSKQEHVPPTPNQEEKKVEKPKRGETRFTIDDFDC